MKWFLSVMCAALFLVGGVSLAFAQDAQVNWTYDVAQESGVQGYRIYYGTTTQAGATTSTVGDGVSGLPYDTVIQIANPALRTHTFTLPGTGTYYFRMVTYGLVDGVASESAFSEPEVVAVAGLIPPGGVTVTITLTAP